MQTARSQQPSQLKQEGETIGIQETPSLSSSSPLPPLLLDAVEKLEDSMLNNEEEESGEVTTEGEEKKK